MKYRWNTIRLKPFLTDIKKRSDNLPYHALKKSDSLDTEDPFFVRSSPMNIKDRTNAIFDNRIFRAKRSEIVSAQQAQTCRIDGIGVHGVGTVSYINLR